MQKYILRRGVVIFVSKLLVSAASGCCMIARYQLMVAVSIPGSLHISIYLSQKTNHHLKGVQGVDTFSVKLFKTYYISMLNKPTTFKGGRAGSHFLMRTQKRGRAY